MKIKITKTQMEKIKNLVVPSLVLVLLVVFLTWSTLSAKNHVKRVVITPNSDQAFEEIIKNKKVKVMHEFDDKFTANVPQSEIENLETLGLVEDVVLLEITGDKKPKKKDFVRTCEPNDQIPYNVAQVNGGQLGSGEGIDVAVLDTGAYLEHPDLNIKVCKDTTQKGVRNGCEDIIWHGTHTAGSVGANGGPDGLGIYGVAPDANIWAIKVCFSTECYEDDMAEAIHYAARRGAEVISMSIGGDEPTLILEEAIQAYPDVLFIAAAGNSGPNPDTIQYPAAYTEVVAVGAIDVNKVVTSFSSRGIDDLNNLVVSAREVELAAGGSNVPSTYKNGCYANGSGTSMSTPTVAGLAAKVWQGDAQSTRAYLRTITEDITQSSGGGAGVGYDIASGYGLPVAP